MMKVRTISVADYAKIKWKVKATENEADFTPHCSTIEVWQTTSVRRGGGGLSSIVL